MARMSAGRPPRCTGRSARVRDVTAAAAAAGSRFLVTGSMSAKTGVAPVWMIALAVAQKVNGVVITSDVRTDLADQQRQMQRGRAGVHGHGVRHPNVLCEALLEFANARTAGQPARAKGGDDVFDVGRVDRRTAERNRSSTASWGRRLNVPPRCSD